MTVFSKGLMYRYKSHDDFGLPSSAFTICTFWLIRALYVIGEKEEARSCLRKCFIIQITWDFSVKTLILKPRSNWGIFLKHIPIWHCEYRYIVFGRGHTTVF